MFQLIELSQNSTDSRFKTPVSKYGQLFPNIFIETPRPFVPTERVPTHATSNNKRLLNSSPLHRNSPFFIQYFCRSSANSNVVVYVPIIAMYA